MVPFRTFRGPLFPKPVTGQELFFAVSYSKPALHILIFEGDHFGGARSVVIKCCVRPVSLHGQMRKKAKTWPGFASKRGEAESSNSCKVKHVRKGKLQPTFQSKRHSCNGLFRILQPSFLFPPCCSYYCRQGCAMEVP